tara:strand:- start:374 stop:505 length:132 start_codon:yes stop_codon:yes gene_type:complete
MLDDDVSLYSPQENIKGIYNNSSSFFTLQIYRKILGDMKRKQK